MQKTAALTVARYIVFFMWLRKKQTFVSSVFYEKKEQLNSSLSPHNPSGRSSINRYVSMFNICMLRVTVFVHMHGKHMITTTKNMEKKQTRIMHICDCVCMCVPPMYSWVLWSTDGCRASLPRLLGVPLSTTRLSERFWINSSTVWKSPSFTDSTLSQTHRKGKKRR